MKKKRRIRLQSKKPLFDHGTALKHIAEQYMETAYQLTPLIKAKLIPPNEAVVLIAMYTDAMLKDHNKQHRMTEEEVIVASNLFLNLWKQGLFTPHPDFPYSLQEVLATMGEGRK